MLSYDLAYNRLPERMRKPTTKKLYYVLYGGVDGLFETVESVRRSRNIDLAEGETLDYIGSNVGQFRNGEDDDLYRKLIKVRIIANLSIGDIPTINTVLSVLVKDVYLGLEEAWHTGVYKEPAAIRLQINGDLLNFPVDLINSIKAAGVGIIVEMIAASELELETQAGDYSFPYLRCGEHLAGMEPHILFKGEVFAKELVLDTGEDTARDYKHFGHLRAGEKVNSKNDDLVFRHLSPLDSRYEDSEVFILEDWTND